MTEGTFKPDTQLPPENTPQADAPPMRSSFLLRAGFDSWDEFLALAATYHGSSDAEMMVLKTDTAPDGEAVIGALSNEYGRIIDSFNLDRRQLEQDWSANLISKITLSSSGELRASVGFNGAASADIDVSLGLCMALEDLILEALCVRGFFTSRSERTDRPGSFGILAIGPSSPKRYHDYSLVPGRTSGELGLQITRSLPLDMMRLAQADLLLSLAIRWVVLHEQAHYLLGHLDWMQRHSSNPEPMLAEDRLFASDVSEGARYDNFCLELQADALATQMMVTEWLSIDADHHPVFRQYTECLDRYGAQHDSYSPDLSDRTARFRAVLLASSLAALLFDLRRERTGQTGTTHPPPTCRLLNIMLTATSSWGDIAQYEAGIELEDPDHYAVDTLRPASNAVMTTIFEYEMAARLIDLSNTAYRSTMLFEKDRPAPSRDGVSPLADDFFVLMLQGSKAATSLKTDGGRIFAEMLRHSKKLYMELEPFSRVHGFR